MSSWFRAKKAVAGGLGTEEYSRIYVESEI